jgi:hypothetical protein
MKSASANHFRKRSIDLEKLSDADRTRLTALHININNPLFDPYTYPSNVNTNANTESPPRGNMNAGNANGAFNRNVNMNSNAARDKPDAGSKEPKPKVKP